MKVCLSSLSLAACALMLLGGCKNAPGKPRPGVEPQRPEQVADFATLYKENCAACHGVGGKNGAAISLANPVYLATAGAVNLQHVTAVVVPDTMMPPFAKSAGGTLTDPQIAILAHGMIEAWGDAGTLAGQAPPSYSSLAHGDPDRGQKIFVAACSRCHGADGGGMETGKTHIGSLIDPAYLAMVSDQGLRSIIIAGMPELGMPDWRSDLAGLSPHALSEQEITDTVAWLVSHRTATPGQPYQQHP